MRQLTYFLGLQIQYKENVDLFVNQSKYAKALLIKAGMKHCKPSLIRSKPHTQLLISEAHLFQILLFIEVLWELCSILPLPDPI